MISKEAKLICNFYFIRIRPISLEYAFEYDNSLLNFSPVDSFIHQDIFYVHHLLS